MHELEITFSPDGLNSQKTISDFTGRSEASLERDRWAKRGIPYVKIGRLVRYRGQDVLTYIEQHRIETA